ncbi:hypothetical protein RHS01_04799 [Rhizoctonia solani]|uniref:Uncharacterized protein n=1 Tax=Rhizoctonia solani TaxID=456999 RepID=A0A8H7M5U7_9AGAM|nr:hypothetical protein RHS01_04799 [Rhizoctonia solani]
MRHEGNDAQILEVKFYCSELGVSPGTVVPLAPAEEPSPGKDVEPKEDDVGCCGWEGSRGGPEHLALTEGPTPIRPAIAFNPPSVIFSSDELPGGLGTKVEPIKGAGGIKILETSIGCGGGWGRGVQPNRRGKGLMTRSGCEEERSNGKVRIIEESPAAGRVVEGGGGGRGGSTAYDTGSRLEFQYDCERWCYGVHSNTRVVHVGSDELGLHGE